MITDKEVKEFWNEWDLIMISWGLVSLSAILSVLSFLFLIVYSILLIWIDLPLKWFGLTPLALLMPCQIVLKYVFGFKNMWYLNNTVDGDFGDPKEIEKAGHTGKNIVFIVIWWWFRNITWGYIEKFNPTCNSAASQVSEYRIFHNSRPLLKSGVPNTEWLQENGFFYICYRCKETGKVYCRYSKVTDNYIKQMGAGGDRYKFHLKPR